MVDEIAGPCLGNKSTEVVRGSSEEGCFLQLGADSSLFSGSGYLDKNKKNNVSE